MVSLERAPRSAFPPHPHAPQVGVTVNPDDVFQGSRAGARKARAFPDAGTWPGAAGHSRWDQVPWGSQRVLTGEVPLPLRSSPGHLRAGGWGFRGRVSLPGRAHCSLAQTLLPKRPLGGGGGGFISSTIVQEDPVRSPPSEHLVGTRENPKKAPAVLSDVTGPKRKKTQQLSLSEDNGPFM